MRLSWLIAIGLAFFAFVVLAGVEAFQQSNRLTTSMVLQTAGFVHPSDPNPFPFTLTVLQAAAPSKPDQQTSITMASLRNKPVVLNMWSSSCTICKAETPATESVAQRVKNIVTFVGVDTLDQRDTALAFLHRYHVTYLQLFDPEAKVGSGYGIPGLPVTVFISSHDHVVGEYLGGYSAKTLTHYLATLFGVRVPLRQAALTHQERSRDVAR